MVGFERNLNIYYEPDSGLALVTNVIIRKAAGHTSEQTFRARITASALPEEPGVIRPATLQSSITDPKYDYTFGASGVMRIDQIIMPEMETVSIAFFLNPDELPEGLEGFRLTLSNFGGDFPAFQLPDESSTTLFKSSRNEIIDSDCKC